MEYDSEGKPRIRTTVTGVTIEGDVNVSDVTVNNTEANPVPVSVVGTVDITQPVAVTDNGGSLTVDGTVTALQGTDPWTVDGTVELGATTLSALENINATVSGTVTVDSITGSVTIQDGGGSITVDGSVSATVSGTVSVDNFPATQTVDGTVTVQDGGGSITVDGTVNATISGGTVEATIGGGLVDAFGRLRVSEPFTLFDTRNRYVDRQDYSVLTAVNGSSTYVSNESSFNLAVTAESGSKVYSESKRVMLYQPGKSLLILTTFAMSEPKTNLRQRVGYFGTANGVYFEIANTTKYLVLRSSSSGSLDDTTERVAQANWNTDTLDGSGNSGNPSGLTLNATATQIFWMDIEWLGVGTVRCGFVINGVFVTCHKFHHANDVNFNRVYMTTATLPVRYEIENTGATSGASTMKQICATVISEGGYLPISRKVSYGNNTTPSRISESNTLTALAHFRLNPAYIDSVVVPSQFDILCLDVRYGYYDLLQGTTVTDGTWVDLPNSILQVNATSTGFTGGASVQSGLASSRDEVALEVEAKRRAQFSRDINGNPVVLTAAVAFTQANTDLLWRFGWEELS